MSEFFSVWLCQYQKGQEALNTDWDRGLLLRGSALEAS